MDVLIATLPGDLHAHAVRWALGRLGADSQILYPVDLADGAQWSLDVARRNLAISYGGRSESLALDQFQAIWMRRPPVLFPQEKLTDRDERTASEDDFGTLARSVYKILEQGRFAVNPLDSTRNAGMKPLQFSLASQVGLRMPDTVIGNSPSAILQLFAACDGNVVFKPFKAPIWQTSRGPTIVPTTRITLEMLQASDLAAAPGIFQRCVDKVAEIRVTIMGRSVFAWEKAFESRQDLDVDWRFMFKDAVHRPIRLPSTVEQACFALMKRLDIVFGCFDFIRDADGEIYFLEVNPQGQWLWGDMLDCGLNQLEAMAEFLLSGDPEFRYSGSGRLSYQEFQGSEAAHLVERDQFDHHGHLMTFCYGQTSHRINTTVV